MMFSSLRHRRWSRCSGKIGWQTPARWPVFIWVLDPCQPGRAVARGRSETLWSGGSGLGVAIGPLAGGAVVQGLDWHWTFWINVPVGVTLLPLARKRLAESRGPSRRLDIPGLKAVGQRLEPDQAVIECRVAEPRSPISGQHRCEAPLQIFDEILGNLQRREMSPDFGRPPSDDLPVPLLCPGARTLLDVAGIHTDC
jgi:hypothetical protein